MAIVPVSVIETPQFLRQAEDVWTEDERTGFIDFIARNPEAGDVIPGTGGVRKISGGAVRGVANAAVSA